MRSPCRETSLATRVWRPPGSNTEDLFLLCLELLLTKYALVTKLGEPLQLGHVLRLGSRRNALGLLLAAEVLSHPQPALDRRAASLHTRHGPVGLSRLHPGCGPFRKESHSFILLTRCGPS